MMRTGGDVVIETLHALGARQAVGIPGQHALALFDALRRSPIELLSARVENNAGFMADGIARGSGAPGVLLLSTGPGALTSLAALMESFRASVPIVVVCAQVPTAGLGGGRHGYLHELDDQSAAFAQVVKTRRTVRSFPQIPSALRDAWEEAMTAPAGPVLIEVPQDILLSEALDDEVPPVGALSVAPPVRLPREEVVAAAVALLESARRPVVLCGGGVVRAGAGEELRALAESLDAPVVTTFSAKSGIPLSHPLAAGSWLEDIATTRFLEDADVLLIVGTSVGELSSNYGTFAPAGAVIQIDADLGVVGSNHRVLGVHADARASLRAILDRIRAEPDDERRARRVAEIAKLRAAIHSRLDAQGLEHEQRVLDAIRSALPEDADSYWDMTMLAYWAWSAWDARAGEFVSPQGAGGLGYAFPAAIGAAFADRGRPVLAVSGDGGAMYGIAELASAVQAGVDVTWLIVDDGGYGILETYMQEAFGASMATDLVTPDFVALAGAFGVDARRSTPESLEEDLRAALRTPGPSVVALDTRIALFAPSHGEHDVPAGS